MKIWAEYIWIGGMEPIKRVKTLRSKGRLINIGAGSPHCISLDSIPPWAFDGSSTYQAEGNMSDVRLIPVYFIRDPVRKICGDYDILVLCETQNIDGTPHETNTRRLTVEAAEKYKKQEAIFGFEQEYTFYDREGKRPLCWPQSSDPAPQGRYYCGVGCDEVFGEEIMEAHTKACIKAGLALAGINAEVMPAQGEFQIGPLAAPEAADQLWLARWLLYKVASKFGVSVKLDPKPIEEGDWNGAGCHVNFSTKIMREAGGLKEILKACDKLGQHHKEHMAVYGPFNEKRLTGKYETCKIDQFRYAPFDRGASVRIPVSTMINKAGGYLEDRRPAANIDPYEVCLALLETICGDGFKPRREADVKLEKAGTVKNL